jgi:hypothetical protein
MKVIEKIDTLLEFVNVWSVKTNKREIIVMAANKKHAIIQAEEQLKTGEKIKKVTGPK